MTAASATPDDAAYALLLIDRHKPGVYSTLQLLDQRWWDWIYQAPPADLVSARSVLIPLPEGCSTDDGETAVSGTVGSFTNDLMHAASSSLDEAAKVKIANVDAWSDDDEVRRAAHAALAVHGISGDRVAEGLWY